MMVGEAHNWSTKLVCDMGTLNSTNETYTK